MIVPGDCASTHPPRRWYLGGVARGTTLMPLNYPSFFGLKTKARIGKLARATLFFPIDFSIFLCN
jgi:hypothetical protein